MPAYSLYPLLNIPFLSIYRFCRYLGIGCPMLSPHSSLHIFGEPNRLLLSTTNNVTTRELIYQNHYWTSHLLGRRQRTYDSVDIAHQSPSLSTQEKWSLHEE